MNTALLRRPSAVAPILMSLAALLLVLGYVALHGAAREPDEGTAAHLFQLLVVLQLPFAGFHALRWLPRSPASGVRVLLLQLAALAVACAPVAALGL